MKPIMNQFIPPCEVHSTTPSDKLRTAQDAIKRLLSRDWYAHLGECDVHFSPGLPKNHRKTIGKWWFHGIL